MLFFFFFFGLLRQWVQSFRCRVVFVLQFTCKLFSFLLLHVVEKLGGLPWQHVDYSVLKLMRMRVQPSALTQMICPLAHHRHSCISNYRQFLIAFYYCTAGWTQESSVIKCLHYSLQRGGQLENRRESSHAIFHVQQAATIAFTTDAVTLTRPYGT